MKQCFYDLEHTVVFLIFEECVNRAVLLFL